MKYFLSKYTPFKRKKLYLIVIKIIFFKYFNLTFEDLVGIPSQSSIITVVAQVHACIGLLTAFFTYRPIRHYNIQYLQIHNSNNSITCMYNYCAVYGSLIKIIYKNQKVHMFTILQNSSYLHFSTLNSDDN